MDCCRSSRPRRATIRADSSAQRCRSRCRRRFRIPIPATRFKRAAYRLPSPPIIRRARSRTQRRYRQHRDRQYLLHSAAESRDRHDYRVQPWICQRNLCGHLDVDRPDGSDHHVHHSGSGQRRNGSNFTVAATASSGLTVAYTSSGSCSIPARPTP